MLMIFGKNWKMMKQALKVFKVKFSKQVRNFLKKLTANERGRFKKAIESIRKDPYNSLQDVKKLTGKKDYWRLRIGPYRIIYKIEANELLIYFIKGKMSGDVYKKQTEIETISDLQL